MGHSTPAAVTERAAVRYGNAGTHPEVYGNVTPEEVEEFRRLVKATGGKVPRHNFSPCEKDVEAIKARLEAVGLIADWTRDDRGNSWCDIKGLKEAA